MCLQKRSLELTRKQRNVEVEKVTELSVHKWQLLRACIASARSFRRKTAMYSPSKERKVRLELGHAVELNMPKVTVLYSSLHVTERRPTATPAHETSIVSLDYYQD